ncbi:unnamed protein product [Oikopleura dioica]|uniref:Lysosome-associated membrane glycoprotein 5 n=1 Tax=Oikopleura dioica TaxID=34765 RepID=E4WWE4_OIKDI|nr:unnamed protein product [Oikopleura dioica]
MTRIITKIVYAVPAAPKNQTWVAQDSTNTTQFIANAAFRVWTKFEYAPHKGYCPGALDFTDTKKITAKHLILDGDEWVSVTFNETAGDKTKELELVLKNNGVDYFVQNVSATFSWNNFEGSNDTTTKTIRNDKIHGYPVPAGKAYNCQAAAEVQLAPEEKQIQGLKIQPAIWEAFSDFGNRTVVNNTDECLFDFNDVTPEKVSWNITVTDGKNTTVCGKLAMSTLVNVNYTSILGEDMVANFAISNTTEITHSMSKTCSNDSLSVTFWIKELDFNAANITMDFTTNTNGTFWSLSHATLSYPNGGNPLFPNTNVHAGVTTISSNATLFNTTYGSAFMCHDKHWINATDTWYMQIEDVTIQPFNLTNQDYG